MKKLIFLASILATFVFISSCSKESTELKEEVVPQSTISNSDFDLSFLPFDYPLPQTNSASTRSQETVPSYDFSLNEVGTSKLTRNANGVTVVFKAENLDPSLAGHAVTMWWVLWEDYPCCFIDWGFANGKVIGNNGKVNISAHLNEGDVEGFMGGIGLTDAETTEIHLVVRSHNIKDPAYMPAQINSFCGGCAPNGDGCDDGPYICEDRLFSIHDPE